VCRYTHKHTKQQTLQKQQETAYKSACAKINEAFDLCSTNNKAAMNEALNKINSNSEIAINTSLEALTTFSVDSSLNQTAAAQALITTAQTVTILRNHFQA